MGVWIKAMRLRTLPLTFACIGMGGFLAASKNSFDLWVFLLCLTTALSLQILSNLANDYGDSIHGVDGADRMGPDRAVQSGEISKRAMKRGIYIAAIVSFISGLTLLWISALPSSVFWIFIGLGILSIISAVLYTNGSLPYGYIGLGDISVFLFFGMVGVVGTFYLQSKSLTWDLLLPAASCGLLTVAVLNINNIRDLESDKKAGKFSIPVRLGRSRAVMYHTFLLVLGMLTALSYVFINYSSVRQLLFLLILPLLMINVNAVKTKLLAKELDPYLKQMAIITLIFVLIFGMSQL